MSAKDESAADARRIAHIAIAERFADGVAEAAAGEPTDALAVAVDRLAAEQRDFGVIDRETGQETGAGVAAASTSASRPWNGRPDFSLTAQPSPAIGGV